MEIALKAAESNCCSDETSQVWLSLTWACPALAPENTNPRGCHKKSGQTKAECPNRQRTCSPWETSPKQGSDLITTALPLPVSIKPFILIIWAEQGWEHKVYFCIIKMKRFCWGLITLEMQRLLQKYNEYQIYLQKGLFIKIKSWWKMPLLLYFPPDRFKDSKSRM